MEKKFLFLKNWNFRSRHENKYRNQSVCGSLNLSILLAIKSVTAFCKFDNNNNKKKTQFGDWLSGLCNLIGSPEKKRKMLVLFFLVDAGGGGVGVVSILHSRTLGGVKGGQSLFSSLPHSNKLAWLYSSMPLLVIKILQDWITVWPQCCCCIWWWYFFLFSSSYFDNKVYASLLFIFSSSSSFSYFLISFFLFSDDERSCEECRPTIHIFFSFVLLCSHSRGSPFWESRQPAVSCCCVRGRRGGVEVGEKGV